MSVQFVTTEVFHIPLLKKDMSVHWPKILNLNVTLAAGFCNLSAYKSSSSGRSLSTDPVRISSQSKDQYFSVRKKEQMCLQTPVKQNINHI